MRINEQITRIQKLINELSPDSSGFQELYDLVTHYPEVLAHLNFGSMKSLKEYLLDADYSEFQQIKNEVEFLMIDNSTGIEKLMTSGSGYEKTIASLALRSVLTKICTLPKPNLVVMDEVFGKISNENLEMVSEFFIKIKEQHSRTKLFHRHNRYKSLIL